MNPAISWPHHDPQGRIIGEIRRYIPGRNGKTKEDIPCYKFEGGRFIPGIPEEMKEAGYLPFGLKTIHDKTEPLFVVEGQKKQTALAGLGFQCVTSILGANSPHLTNWETLGKIETIYLLSDQDEAGKNYIQNVWMILNRLNSLARFFIVRLPGLSSKGDVCDWLKKQPELSAWDELSTLENHPARQTLKERLQKTIEACLESIPHAWNQKTHSILLDDWPEPKLIKNEIKPVYPLPLEIIPEPFQEWVLDIAHRMQCPIDFIAVPALIMTGSIIGTGCGIRPKLKDDWLIIPNLWGGIVGRPSMLKSPALAEGLKPLGILEAQAKEKIDQALKHYEAENEMFKATKEALKSDMLSAAKGKSGKGEIEAEVAKRAFVQLQEPQKPIWRRYKTNDSTVPKMSELLAENHRGLLLFRDELVGLFATWDKEGNESDRAFYLESWNGYGSHTTDRIGRGTIHTENLCVSLLGGIQPDKLLMYLHSAMRAFQNDGFIQRLQLLVYPDEIKDWQLIDEFPHLTAKNRVMKIIEKLAQMDFGQYGAALEEGEKIHYFQFDKEAQSLFNEWLTELQTQTLTQDENPIILEHLSKYRSLMPSLALIFHLIEIVDGKTIGPVSLQSAQKAAAWCGYLESHARRIYGLISDLALRSASKLAQKIQKGDLEDNFTVRNLYRKEWGLLNTRELAQAACEELVEAGWIKKSVTLAKLGHKKKVEYKINPKVRRKS